jgi:chromosome segregation ATPase
MRTNGRLLFLTTIVISLLGPTCRAQDAPSLGDVARQQRQKQAKADSTKNAKPSKVITNEELPEHASPAASLAANDSENPSAGSSSGNGEKASAEAGKLSAERWKSQIQGQKSQIASLQHEADELNESIHFLGANCVANCVQWNERQQEKQHEVERLRSQVEEQKKRLEDMQESARKQGYGSSVYDP